MTSSSFSVCSILDIPDEILAKIFLHFNARERLALANSCERFNNLVFGDKELLRNLDFSREWQITSEADIQQYFMNENTYKNILRINIENVNAENILSTSIGKAINLIDLNILNGPKFSSNQELCSFLKPLVHLKRLSVNWPILDDYSAAISHEVLEKPLSRLTYLSIGLYRYSIEFLLALQFCQELEELRIMTVMPSRDIDVSSSREPVKLRNLKIAQFCGIGSSGPLKNGLIALVPDPAEWTDFHLVDPYMEGYLERSVELCEELLEVKEMPLPRSILHNNDGYIAEINWHLIPENLLSKVIKFTHEGAPEKFCCLSWSTHSDRQPCLLKIAEAKRLLKDPGYQISYLHFSHVIEKNCDVHLLASVFPNLTELVISRISNKNSNIVPGEYKRFHRRLTKRGSISREEHNDLMNSDSSFEMLIENTRHLRGLTISPTDAYNTRNESTHWDLDALNLIPRWNNLTAIRLKDIPITDGNFLIDIGKECTKLEEVMLCRLGTAYICCYANELLQMLELCINLKIFSICQTKIENMSEVFSTLSNNSNLRQVRLMTNTQTFDSRELASSIGRMLHGCLKLTKFVINIDSSYHLVVDELKLALQRIVSELNRPNLQFHGPDRTVPSTHYLNPSNSFFPNPLDDKEFADYWL